MPDREKVIKEFEHLLNNAKDNYQDFVDLTVDGGEEILAILEEQDAKIGKWIPVTNSRGGMECNICHDYAPSYQSGAEYLSKYCPNCGAKMEGR